MSIINYKLLKLAGKAYGLAADRIDLLPRTVAFETTKICNLKCVGCPRNAKGNLAKQKGDKHLSLETVRKVVDELPIKTVGFGGDGEPFLNPNLLDILEYLSKKNIYSTIITNGTIMTEQLAKDFRKLKVYELCFSYWGTSKETHEPLRVGSDFNKLVYNTQLASEYLRTTVWYLITRSTVRDLPYLKGLLDQTGCVGITFLKPVVKTLNTPEDFLPPDWQASKEVIQEVLKSIKKKEIYTPLSSEPKILKCYKPSQPIVTIKGDIVPCWMIWGQGDCEIYGEEILRTPDQNYLLGNINKNTFRELWSTEKYKRLRRVVKELNRKKEKEVSRETLIKLRRGPLEEEFGYCKVCQWRWGEAYN